MVVDEPSTASSPLNNLFKNSRSRFSSLNPKEFTVNRCTTTRLQFKAFIPKCKTLWQQSAPTQWPHRVLMHIVLFLSTLIWHSHLSLLPRWLGGGALVSFISGQDIWDGLLPVCNAASSPASVMVFFLKKRMLDIRIHVKLWGVDSSSCFFWTKDQFPNTVGVSQAFKKYLLY